MSNEEREGTLPAPHEHIQVNVWIFQREIQVTYYGTRRNFIDAGLLDDFMLNKIATQKGGLRRDAAGVPFSLLPDSPKRKGDGDAHRLVRVAKTADQALALPGVRELHPNGIHFAIAEQSPTRKRSRPPQVSEVSRQVGRPQRRISWLVDGNVIFPDWQALQRAAAAAWREARSP